MIAATTFWSSMALPIRRTPMQVSVHSHSVAPLLPLEVLSVFSTKSIQQSTPVPGALNILTITLKANFDLKANSTVTISGLTGSQTTGTSLAVTSTFGLLGTLGLWNQISGQLVLTVAINGTIAGTSYQVVFALQNTATNQASPMVNVAVNIHTASGFISIGAIAQGAMVKPGTKMYGVGNGANPLEVLVPFFSVKSIKQSTFVSGAINKLMVNLMANYELKAGSTVTISGLTGSQTLDTANLPISSTSSIFGTAGVWTQAGVLVLTAASMGLTPEINCVVTFDVTNTVSDQESPAVSVRAAILDAISVSVGSIAQAAMSKPGTALYGVANGADPLKVLVLKSIGISTFVVTMVVQMSYTLLEFDEAIQVFVSLVYLCILICVES